MMNAARKFFLTGYFSCPLLPEKGLFIILTDRSAVKALGKELL
jgi:hypothetical protein